jgi:alanine dehydrogenase
MALADHGWQRALREDAHLRNGLNICRGRIAHPAVARDLELPFTAPEKMLAGA